MDTRDLISESIRLGNKLAQMRKAAHPGYPAALTPKGDKFRRLQALEYAVSERTSRRFLKLKNEIAENREDDPFCLPAMTNGDYDEAQWT